MSDLPEQVSTYLDALISHTRQPAWLRIGADGRVVDLGGALSTYHLEALKPGDSADEQLIFLQGLLPLDTDRLVLPFVTAEPVGCVEVHILSSAFDSCVILLTAAEEAERRRVVQQKINELALLRESIQSTRERDLHAPSPLYSGERAGVRGQASSSAEIERNFTNCPSPYPSSSSTGPDVNSVDPLFCDLPAALEILIFECLENGHFRVIPPAPPWYHDFAPIAGEAFDPIARFPVLEIVMPDAEAAWSRNQTHRSEVWTEIDASGNPIHLEATALAVRSRHMLLITRIDSAFHQRQSLLQMARERRLAFEKQIASAANARTKAESANRDKSQFLADMSHELRSPLAAILGFSELLEEQSASEGDQRGVADMKKIRAAGNHLLSLINEVLNLSRVEAGRMRLNVEQFDVRRLVEDVIATASPLAAKNGNTLRLECPIDPGIMRSDAMKVRQCLLNLLANSAKFTTNGTITVTLARRAHDNSEWIECSVRDTGIGMTAAQMARLFQPFAQADPSIAKTYGGTGLGLAISQQYCRLLGGDITVQSTAGEGSTFTLRLPARIEGAEE